MKKTLTLATSLAAILAAGSAMAQDDQTEVSNQPNESEAVTVLTNWSYEGLYAGGWSVDNFIWSGTVNGSNGDEIGNVENVIFSDDGEPVALIAEVGGFWDIGDTHISVPWDQVQISDDGQTVTIPVTEDSVSDFDLFADPNMFGSETVDEETVQEPRQVDDELEAGADVFKASDFIGDYAYLSDDAPYGYVNDLIVSDGRIQSIVIDAASYYGEPGYYAYPYETGANWDPYARRYSMPYAETDVQSLDTFDYDRLTANPS